MAGLGGDLGTRILKEVEEIERHIHNLEKWFGLAAIPVGETHRMDRMAGGIQRFQFVAGNDDFGAWVQVIGSEDTPVIAGSTLFDTHRFLVTGTDSTNAFIFQVVSGESADIAAKIAAGEYNSVPYISASNNNDSGIEDILGPRVPAGEKVWVRVACIGASGSIISAYFGLHEYPE